MLDLERNPLRDNIALSCQLYLKNSIEAARESYGTRTIPEHSYVAKVLEPTEPGRWKGVERSGREIAVFEIWERIIPLIQLSQEWQRLSELLEQYIQQQHVEPPTPWGYDIPRNYLYQLFRQYIERTKLFSYQERVARSVANDLLAFLDSDQVCYTHLFLLDGFSAERPFRLAPELYIRPIRNSELLRLGRRDSIFIASMEPLHIQSDWWVCEAILSGPKGSAVAHNRGHEVHENLRTALRLFKTGRVRTTLGLAESTSPYARMGTTRGGRMEPIFVGDGAYHLTRREISRFSRFWRELQPILNAPRHYLHAAIRRIRSAGTRREKEDALVDCVIGLEALLGRPNERTEMSYRFQIRGAVLLARLKGERIAYRRSLSQLYDLRSRIVHGVGYQLALDTALAKAEEYLRRIWFWYFERWRFAPDNTSAIDWIDDELLGKQAR